MTQLALQLDARTALVPAPRPGGYPQEPGSWEQRARCPEKCRGVVTPCDTCGGRQWVCEVPAGEPIDLRWTPEGEHHTTALVHEPWVCACVTQEPALEAHERFGVHRPARPERYAATVTIGTPHHSAHLGRYTTREHAHAAVERYVAAALAWRIERQQSSQQCGSRQ